MDNTFLSRALTRNEVFWTFGVALFVYVWPVMSVGYLYYDDVWRTYFGPASWVTEGRILIAPIYNIMGFNASTPNVYPLPLTLSVCLMIFALRYWVFKLFDRPTLSSCLVVLPIFYSPFFLQNLSYQYDGPAMLLSVAAVIYASCCQFSHAWKTVVACSGLLFCALALYQLSINLFIMLCCIGLIRHVNGRVPLVNMLSLLSCRVISLGVAMGIYYIGVYPHMSEERQHVLVFGYESIVIASTRLVGLLMGIVPLFPATVKGIMVVLLGIAVIGYIFIGRRIFQRDSKVLLTTFLAGAYLLVIPLACVCVSGLSLLFSDFNGGFRTLLGASGVLVMVFYLSHKVLVGLRWWAGFVLAIPLMYALSVSYGYGRVLIFQQQLEHSVLTGMAYDIRHGEVNDLNVIYMVLASSVESPPAAQALYFAMPVLKNIAALNYVVLPEMFPRVGINNVYVNRDEVMEKILREGGYKPIVATADYEIYVIGGAGYIVLKDVVAPLYDQANLCAQKAIYSC